MKHPLLIVIDGNAILHRAYHALPPMTTKSGLLVNAAYGFTVLLLNIVKEYQPEALCVTFDVKGGTFRDEIYKEYKATRVKQPQELYDQIDFIKHILDSFGIVYFEKKGFEADDVIGTIAAMMRKEKTWHTAIVTGDSDEFQLVTEAVSVIILKKGISEVMVYDEKAVKDRYGLTPKQLIDFKALKGDSSDNIKGVKGIGEKSAEQLIQVFSSVEGLYAELEKTGTLEGFSASVIKKLVEGKADALLSKQLVTIETAVPLDFTIEKVMAKPLSREIIEPVLREYEFTTLLKRMHFDEGVQPVVKKKKSSSVKELDEQEVSAWIKQVNTRIAVHITKQEQVSMFDDAVGTVAIATKKETVLWKLTPQTALLTIALLERAPEVITFDAKKMYHTLGVADARVFQTVKDVMILGYVLQAGREVLIADLAFEHGGVALADEPSTSEIAQALLATYEPLVKAAEEAAQEKVVETIEYPLLPILYHMERAGIMLDVKELRRLSVEAEKEIDRVSTMIFRLAGREFNIASPQQLGVVLFEELELPTVGIKRGKTGISTAASELEKLEGEHEIIAYISEFRELAKLKSTYIDALPPLVDVHSRIHTTFSQVTAATGRLSSINPNVQNIPARSELGKKIRGCLVAQKGCALVSIDYSQFELRIAAHISNDPVLIDIFKRGADVHTSTAASIHGIPESEVTKEIRYSAKEVNFGVLYGMGAFGLASRTGLSRGEASDFIEKYFVTFKKLKDYMEDAIASARSKGYAETLLGRRRALPELVSGAPQLRASGERMAINMPIQGSQADIIKLAMIQVDEALKTFPHATMVLQVHDELVFEVREGYEEALYTLVKPIMEHVYPLKVPITVEGKFGKNWNEMEKMD